MVKQPQNNGKRGTRLKTVDLLVAGTAVLLFAFVILRLVSFLRHEQSFEDFPPSYWRESLEKEDPDSQNTSTRLQQAGVAAVPVLHELLHCENALVRGRAACVLAEIHPGARLALPVLLEHLKAPESLDRRNAAHALGCMGPNAKGAIAALGRALEDPNGRVRVQAAWALWRIDRRAEILLPFILREGGDKDPGVGLESCLAFFQLAPKGRDGFSAFMEALRIRASVAVPVLSRMLREQDHGSREGAAAVLGGLGPAAKHAIPALTEAIKDPRGMVRVLAANALWEICADTKISRAVLLKALTDDDREVRASALKVLKKIDPEAVRHAGVP